MNNNCRLFGPELQVPQLQAGGHQVLGCGLLPPAPGLQLPESQGQQLLPGRFQFRCQQISLQCGECLTCGTLGCSFLAYASCHLQPRHSTGQTAGAQAGIPGLTIPMRV